MSAHVMYLAAAHAAHHTNGGMFIVGLALIAIAVFSPKKKGG